MSSDDSNHSAHRCCWFVYRRLVLTVPRRPMTCPPLLNMQGNAFLALQSWQLASHWEGMVSFSGLALYRKHRFWHQHISTIDSRVCLNSIISKVQTANIFICISLNANQIRQLCSTVTETFVM